MFEIKDYTKGFVSDGNLALLSRVMKKAKHGERVTICALGGSITNGSASSDYSDHRYANIMVEWWKNRFANIDYYNAGIGATGSIIGIHRLERDILCHNPDLVTIDFAVNDFENTPATRESYENIIRRCLERGIAVVLLFMSDKDANNVQADQSKIGEYYDLPMLSYRDLIWYYINNGDFKWTDIQADEVHPNDAGHAVLGAMICAFWDKVYAQADTNDEVYTLPDKLLSVFRYRNARLLMNDEITPTANNGFKEIKENGFHQFPYGWTGNGSIEFTADARNVGFIYLRRADNADNNGKAEVFVNGEMLDTLDSDFSGGWGNYAEYKMVKFGDRTEKTTITIKSADDKEFTVLALLLS